MTPLQFIEETKNDIAGDVGIQVALMIDKAFPNKYSSSFRETIEEKVAKIVNARLLSLLQLERERVRGIIKEKLPVLWSDNVNRHLENVAKHNALSDVLTALEEGREDIEKDDLRYKMIFVDEGSERKEV